MLVSTGQSRSHILVKVLKKHTFICMHTIHTSKYTYASAPFSLCLYFFLSLHICVHLYIYIVMFCKFDNLISFLELLLPDI